MSEVKKYIFRKLFVFLPCVFLAGIPLQNIRAMGLKQNSVVTENTIKLGDIFYGLPRDEDRVIGAAPLPGHDMVLNARTLLRIALALDLPWRPTSSNETVVLKRQATIIDQKMITDHIKDALANEGVNGNYTVNLPEGSSQIVLPFDQPALMEVTQISFDPSANRFDAFISAPSRENPIQKMQISGEISPLILVPVLKDTMQSGQIINATDLSLAEVKEKDFVAGTIVDEDKLIGMTPRNKVLISGRPIRQNEIIAPKIVSRGDFVTISLQSGALNLTTEGKAMESGAKGDIIRVVNTSSNIAIQAIITGEKEVRVSSN